MWCSIRNEKDDRAGQSANATGSELSEGNTGSAGHTSAEANDKGVVLITPRGQIQRGESGGNSDTISFPCKSELTF